MDYIAPKRGLKQEDCNFYHTVEFDDGEVVKGMWDLRAVSNRYLGEVDFAGKTALDVGAASGFFTFQMEKSGAVVTSFDTSSSRNYDYIPYADEQSDYDAIRDEMAENVKLGQNAYWYNHERMNSEAKVVYGNVYDLPFSKRSFDIVFMGLVLPHLADPCRALEQVASAAKERVILTGSFHKAGVPIIHFAGRHTHPSAPFLARISWWDYSLEFIEEFMGALGFELERSDSFRSYYEWQGAERYHPITACVFKRKPGEAVHEPWIGKPDSGFDPDAYQRKLEAFGFALRPWSESAHISDLLIFRSANMHIMKTVGELLDGNPSAGHLVVQDSAEAEVASLFKSISTCVVQSGPFRADHEGRTVEAWAEGKGFETVLLPMNALVPEDYLEFLRTLRSMGVRHLMLYPGEHRRAEQFRSMVVHADNLLY